MLVKDLLSEVDSDFEIVKVIHKVGGETEIIHYVDSRMYDWITTERIGNMEVSGILAIEKGFIQIRVM